MKTFDRMDSFHERLIKSILYYSFIFLPLLGTGLAVWAADHFFFKQFKSIISWLVVFICAILGYFLSLLLVMVIGSAFEGVLDYVRKLMGRERIGKAVRRHKEEEIERIEKNEETFTSLGINKQLLELLRSQQYLVKEQVSNFTYLTKRIKHLKYIIIAMLILLLLVLLQL